MIESAEILDQLFEDLAGEELNEYMDDFALDTEYSRLTEVDEFADIDNHH